MTHSKIGHNCRDNVAPGIMGSIMNNLLGRDEREMPTFNVMLYEKKCIDDKINMGIQ